MLLRTILKEYIDFAKGLFQYLFVDGLLKLGIVLILMLPVVIVWYILLLLIALVAIPFEYIQKFNSQNKK